MKITPMVVPLLVAFILGVQPGGVESSDDSVVSESTFLDKHTNAFLVYMEGHFDKSLEYLLEGNAAANQRYERPGMAKVLKKESDRHWDLGIEVLKKYLQRGGETPAAPTSGRHHVTFKNKFKFSGQTSNFVGTTDKPRPNFTNTYLKQCKKLVTDTSSTVTAANKLYKLANFDADIGHFIEEKVEKEVELMRMYSDLCTSLEKMENLGLAQHIFDKSLAD